jgi:Ca-activated chloride channel homolog
VFNWELRDPWFLLLVPLAIVSYWLASRSRSSLVYSSLSLLRETNASLRMWLVKLPALLFALATLAMIVGLARPRTPERETRVSRDGIAIMMVVDLSSSMNARDLVEEDRSINRLDVVKRVFLDFVLGNTTEQSGLLSAATAFGASASRGRPDDLIGLVTFAGYADSVCPLTLDHGNLANIVKDLQIVTDRAEDGTAVGDGLGLAVERLRRSKAKSHVAILLTDGVNNAGVIPPLKAAELAAESQVKVYCIGAGTNGVAPMPYNDAFGRPMLVAQPVEIDEETLKQIAEKTGGQYFRAENIESLRDVYREIDQLEKTEVTELRYLRYTEHFPLLVASALGLLGIAAVLSLTLLRKLP